MDIDKFYTCKKYFKDLPDELYNHINKVKITQLKSKKNKKKPDESNWIIKYKINQDDDEKLKSKFKSILNKISNENFNDIVDELLQLEIENSDQLEKFVDMIFKKAVREKKYSNVYVRLCSLLYSRYIINDDEKKIYFRTFLLSKCQNCFINSLKTEKEDDLIELGFRNKQDLIGLILFIGRMYNEGLLTNSIIYDCIIILISKINENKWYGISTLCSLVDTVKNTFKNKCPEKYKIIINFLNNLTKNKNIKAKDRFMVMDVLGI